MMIVYDSKVRGANMGPTWVLSAPDGPHVGPMNLAIRGAAKYSNTTGELGDVDVGHHVSGHVIIWVATMDKRGIFVAREALYLS